MRSSLNPQVNIERRWHFEAIDARFCLCYAEITMNLSVTLKLPSSVRTVLCFSSISKSGKLFIWTDFEWWTKKCALTSNLKRTQIKFMDLYYICNHWPLSFDLHLSAKNLIVICELCCEMRKWFFVYLLFVDERNPVKLNFNAPGRLWMKQIPENVTIQTEKRREKTHFSGKSLSFKEN